MPKESSVLSFLKENKDIFQREFHKDKILSEVIYLWGNGFPFARE
jgi:hypothetical protein